MAPNPGIPFLQDSINLNSQQMAQHVDQYFRDIGFEGLRAEFFERSVFVQRTFQMSCEKSAWDFQTSDEFRISLCAKPTRQDIHEMIYLFAKGSKIQIKIRIKNDLLERYRTEKKTGHRTVCPFRRHFAPPLFLLHFSFFDRNSSENSHVP